ncbi:MAG: glycine cleavage system protein GcvH [Deltaproteobacteria bacterium]|nr:glycine cleavage system protein GcvH [Deltaproteobacteria bacterium]
MEKTYPKDLKYTKEHEWCQIEGDIATVGITWHAQDALGDIVYCELPEVGDSVNKGETFGVVESVKAVSDLYSPVSGEVMERNETVLESPETLNQDMYSGGWMVRVRLGDAEAAAADLMSQPEYEAFLAEGSE